MNANKLQNYGKEAKTNYGKEAKTGQVRRNNSNYDLSDQVQ